MSKQLLIEEAEFTTPIKIEKGLKESISVENNKDVLIVRNIPATIADRKNQNGRIYTTEVLQEAIKNANFQLKTKWMYSQADEHPEGSFVKPSHASHVVINAYIKKNVKVFVEGKTERHNVMFMDWEILNTEEGKNLKALILQETACPTSIRGLGDMEGEYVTNYELLGCDVVSNPSSGTSMRMPVSESIKVESSDKSYLDESFEVVTVSNDVVSDVEAAAQKQVDIENANYGTITNIKTKLDQEIDPKTHAETTITSIEATTTDEVSELNQALQMAQNAFANPVSKMDSVTITYIDDAEKAKESTVADAPCTKELEEKEDTCPCCGKSPCECPDDCKCKKEFLDLNADIDDINVLDGMVASKEESNNETVNDTVINGLESAIKELNDQILKEQDPEKLKTLKMNRDELEKLLNKNKEIQAKDSEEITEELDKKDSDIEVKGNKLSLQLDKDTTIEKELDSQKAAEIAKAGLDNGKLNPEFMVSEDMQGEQLCANPDEPSDALVDQPLTDSDNTVVNIVLTDLDYDISDPENISADDEQYLSELPHEVTVNLELSKIPQEGEIDQFIIANAAEQTGLPIKNAKIKSASVDLLNKPQEESIDEGSKSQDYRPGFVNGCWKIFYNADFPVNYSPKEFVDLYFDTKEDCQAYIDNLDNTKESVVTEGENGTYTVYAFLNGQLKDEVEDITEKDNAIQKAESFKQQYENQGANFQVIVTKIDDKGFEDFDQLVYQYPDVEIADDEINEQ